MQRNVTGLVLRRGATWDLFDCGEATQHQILRTSLSISKLRRVFISHLHGDHCFGLFGLLGSRSMDGCTEPLTVFGPKGLKPMVETVLELSDTHLNFPLEIRELSEHGERLVEDSSRLGGETIDALPLSHRVTSFGWHIVEADRPGVLDAAAARAAGVPEGPLFGALQRGEAVEVDGGWKVQPKDVLGPTRRGRRLVIGGDNNAPSALFERTGGADLAVHEATFTESVLAKMPNDRGHSTAARVAHAATTHGVRSLVLTHFSARYGAKGSSGQSIDEVRDEARQHFAGPLHLAEDFDRVVVATDGSMVTS